MEEQVDDFGTQDLVDPKQEMKERRGKTLPVLCVLSFVSIGYSAISSIFSFAQGPLSGTELEEVRVEAMKGIQDDTPEMILKFIIDSLDYAVITNEKFYLINGLGLLIGAIGFLAVFMMYKLKKTGYFIYIVYCVAPIVLQLTLFPGNSLATMISFFIGLFSVVFIILYGVQLKRMD